jgi:hypothetical protein
VLDLVPGRHSLVFNSDGRKISFVGPPGPGTVHLPAHPRRYLITGIVLTALGTLISGTLWAAGDGCPSAESGGVGCVVANLIVWPIVGTTLFFTGVGYLGYYGTHQVTSLDVETPNEDNKPPRVRLSGVGFQPLHNGGAAGVSLSF